MVTAFVMPEPLFGLPRIPSVAEHDLAAGIAAELAGEPVAVEPAADPYAALRMLFTAAIVDGASFGALARILADHGGEMPPNFFRDCCLELAIAIARDSGRGDGWLHLLSVLGEIRQGQQRTDRRPVR